MNTWVNYTTKTFFDPDRVYEQDSELWGDRGKPSGLWICVGDEWMNSVAERFDECFDLTRLTVSMGAPETVRFICNVDEMDAFCLEYGYIPRGPRYLRKRGVDDAGFLGVELCGEWDLVKIDNIIPFEPFPEPTGDFIQTLSDRIGWEICENERAASQPPFYMRWDRIMDDYAGLVIAPHLPARSHIRWYHGWDVPGGVVWDLKRAKITNA